jgi:hypothetical protein
VGKVTYKNLFSLVEERIKKNVQYSKPSPLTIQTEKTLASNLGSASDTSTAKLVSAVQDLLSQALPSFIINGLSVKASSNTSQSIVVSQGKGATGGAIYTIEEPITIKVPFDDNTEVFYVVLYKNNILIQRTYSYDKLTLAKIIVPNPGVTTFVRDTNNNSDDAYIVNFKEVKLYEDGYGKLEEDSIEFLRDNISPILADNLIGNLKLSENLKIINTQGTLELDSDSLKLMDTNENILAKFNKKGVYFYDVNGLEMARFSNVDARIGNILINQDNIGSDNFVSGSKGFRIEDSGYAEFEDVKIRGRISSSVFEYDKMSAVGGQLLIGNSSVLAEDITLAQTTITTEDSVFSLNEILRVKVGNNDEYLQITDVSNAPNYVVIRGLNGYSYVWSKGTAIISTGTIDSGFISLDAVSNHSPFIDIILRNSLCYNDITTKVRLGNLEGITDSLYGTLSGYGLYSDNVYLKGKLYAADIKSISGANCVELYDGNIIANSMTLKDPLNECCYSYLNSGQWYFHDELGNQNPYVKRLIAGEVTTGNTICLQGWKGQPYIQLGIKDLAAYDPNYSVNCQKWCVYYSNLSCYCNSPTDYGWCFDAHATLYKAAGVYDETNKDVAIDTSVYTHSDACWTTVRNRFLLWCFCCASSICYGYGILCYQIKYKCCEAGCAWTCCTYTYTQPHDSTVNLKTCQDICQNICFDSGGCWELQLNCLCLTWCLTSLTSTTYCACCRPLSLCNMTIQVCRYVGQGTYETHTCCDYVALAGSNPSNVYCAYLCYLSCTRFYFDSYYYEWDSQHCLCVTIGACNLETHANNFTCGYHCSWSCYYCVNACFDLTPSTDYTCLCRWGCMYFIAGTMTVCFGTCNDILGSYLMQCYCSLPSNCTCDYERLWSLKDYSETQTILDPNGTLNYLAIGYN